MKTDCKDIINSIPSSWEELMFRQFKQLIHIPISESEEFDGLYNGMDNSLKALSILTRISIEELELMPLSVINQMANRIHFLSKEPNPKQFKTSIKWKAINQITYDNYITFQTLTKTNPFDNLSMLLSSFSTSKISEEEIDELPTSEVLAAFFLLNRIVSKYLTSSIKKESFKLVKLMAKQVIQALCRQRTKK